MDSSRAYSQPSHDFNIVVGVQSRVHFFKKVAKNDKKDGLRAEFGINIQKKGRLKTKMQINADKRNGKRSLC